MIDEKKSKINSMSQRNLYAPQDPSLHSTATSSREINNVKSEYPVDTATHHTDESLDKFPTLPRRMKITYRPRFGNTVKHEQILDIVDRKIDENIPVLEKMIDSLIDHKLQEMIAKYPNPVTQIEQAKEQKMVSILSKIPIVKKLYYTRDGSKIDLVVVHSSSDNAYAIDVIVDQIVDLEVHLPGFYVEPWLYHESEINSVETSGLKILLDRS